MAGNGDQAPVAVVPPQPVPMTVRVSQAPGPDGRLLIMASFLHPVGSFVGFLTGEEAKVIGDELVRLAGPTKAGLVVQSAREV